MRADRLVAALLVLQARGRVTAAQLALELEVSTRTARRDLEALQLAGVPVYAQPGRNGGWSLVGGARTDLTGLTSNEARALFLLAGPAASLAPEARSALRKLVRALPETFRDEAEAAASATRIDPAGWGRDQIASPPHLGALQDAVIARSRVRLAYADRSGVATDRVIDPLGLVDKRGVWYLLASTEVGRRTFRVDRVRGVEPTGETALRPDGLDLEEEWARVVAEVDAQRPSVRATCLALPEMLEALRWVFGREVEVLEDPDPSRPDRTRVAVTAVSADQLVWRLAGFADRVEVLEPLEVRRGMAETGQALVLAYRDPADG